jgi:glycine cleavage system H protein
MWARIDGNIATVGITDYGQEKLGEIFSITLPEVDASVEQNEPFAVIESSKTVEELLSPVTGDVISVNEDLSDDVGIINSDPCDTGWMIAVDMRDLGMLDNLMDSVEYADYVDEEEGA